MLLVVLTFFGGAGLVIYGVCWLFVPEDDVERAPIRVGAEPRKILLLAAAGVAFLLAVATRSAASTPAGRSSASP